MSLTTREPHQCATPEELIAGLPAITLAHLNEAAALQTRTDRKYLLDSAQLSSLVSILGGRLASLEVDGQRSFSYESVYFDTADLESFRSAAYKRSKRFKVRTRSYIDSQTTMLEVKTKNGRGTTIKQRQPHDFRFRTSLDFSAQVFVNSLLGRSDVGGLLKQVLTTRYDRMTLVDLDSIARITIDSGLRCTTTSGAAIGLENRFIVETKSAGSPSHTDRQLWASGIRPTKISKFGTAMAALDPALPSNKWNRTLNEHFRQ